MYHVIDFRRFLPRESGGEPAVAYCNTNRNQQRVVVTLKITISSSSSSSSFMIAISITTVINTTSFIITISAAYCTSDESLRECLRTPNLPINIVDFGGFVSSIILNLRVGNSHAR